MAQITIEIAFKASNTTKTLVIDSDELTMGLLMDVEAARKDGDYIKMIRAYADELGLEEHEMRQLKQGDFKRIVAAISEASKEANDPK